MNNAKEIDDLMYKPKNRLGLESCIEVGNREIGPNNSCFIVAELSANHNQKIEMAYRLIDEAKDCGADAVKLQTYTPDTLTINCDSELLVIPKGPWKGSHLYELYQKAYTPWEWHAELKQYAESIGLVLFSTAFDYTSADFLQSLDVPAYKVSSFELTDLPLIEHIASKHKPIFISTGMGNLKEIDEAVRTAIDAGNRQVLLLKCTSDYPAKPGRMNLSAIKFLQEQFQAPIGLSDHSLTNDVGVAAVAIGACIIEKHLTLDRSLGGPDADFSLEPAEFSNLVTSIRQVEQAMGSPARAFAQSEAENLLFRKSLWVVSRIEQGELFNSENVRSLRPSYGLPPRYLKEILGRKAQRNIEKGTPLSWDLIL